MPNDSNTWWGSANTLMFGWTHEDSAIELAAFSGHPRVFCIAGGGCTALQLAAAGHKVTGVDINPAQIEYVRERASGAPMRAGRVEALMARVRGGLPAIGWTPGRIREFLEFEDAAAQSCYWHRVLDTRRWRLALHALLSPLILRLAYAQPLLAALPGDFSSRLRQRLARGWASHPNRTNPYAWRMLNGTAPFDPDADPQAIRLACADAADFLEAKAPGAFDAFALSNIGDGAPAGYGTRLRNAVRRAGSTDAVVVTRSFVDPEEPCLWNRAADDRSLIWGTVAIQSISEY